MDNKYGSHGEWGKFLKANDISRDKDKNYRKVAYQLMVDAGIVEKGTWPTLENCVEMLKRIDGKCAEMHNLMDQIDMKDIWRHNSPVRINTGSLIDLEPQYARLIGESKSRTQYCRQWNISELLDSLDLLGRFGMESNALQEHIVNEWLDTQSEQKKRPLTIVDFELEPAEVNAGA